MAKKNDKNIFLATAYPIFALALMIMGFVRDPLYFYGAIIISFIGWYWIRKAKRDYGKKKAEAIQKQILRRVEKHRKKLEPEPSEIRKDTPTIFSPRERPKPIGRKTRPTLSDYKSSNHPTEHTLIAKKPKGIEKEIDGHKVYFDKDGYEIFKKWWEIDDKLKILVNKKGYLVSQKGKNKYKTSFHRFLKEKEVEEMAEEIECSKRDIHVHHKNSNRLDNKESNLMVLHKEDHAKEHGFNSWKDFQRYRNSHK
jgi:hypothetical protein